MEEKNHIISPAAESSGKERQPDFTSTTETLLSRSISVIEREKNRFLASTDSLVEYRRKLRFIAPCVLFLFYSLYDYHWVLSSKKPVGWPGIYSSRLRCLQSTCALVLKAKEVPDPCFSIPA
jgi:hypothetical protein